MEENNPYSDLFRLDDRRAMVIGAGGIGGEVARALAALSLIHI